VCAQLPVASSAAGAVEHRTRYVEWGDIETIERDLITLRCSADDLPFLRDVA
jgi:hypothetical protein